MLGTEPAAVLKARGEGWTAFLSVARNFAFSSTARYHAPHGRAGNDPSISSPVRPWFRGRESACRPPGADIHFGCQIYDRLEGNGEIDGVPGRNEPLYFFDLLYAIDAAKSARHHPEGVLWVHTREHAIHSEAVSILDIAPTIFDLMGVRNTIAEASARGVSLVPRFRSSSQAEEKQVA